MDEAVEYADTAMRDMADNANTFGTDLSSIQTAYQGFAKQNYTMLDNLKLGYGGTKSEMERLLSDAEKLTGVHYDINNLGDVYSAIHAIQGDLGLTGVAAEEASQTFSGSFNAMKASAQNLLGSLALGQNVGPAMNQLMTSVSTFFFGNFLPMIGTLVRSLPSAIVAFLRTGLPMLVSNVSSLLTSLASQITNFANGVSSGQISKWAQTQLPHILKSGGKLMLTLASALIKNLPKIVVAIGKIGLAIVKGLGSAIWGKVRSAAQGIATRFMAPINTLRAKVKAVIDKVKSLFPFKIGKVMSNIKLPHFKVSGKFGLNPPQTPKLSLSWYAKGGIMDGPTLFGMAGGEAGPEAILPLDPFWRKMDEIANSIRQTPNGGAEITVVVNLDGREVARTTAPYMETEINRIQNRANRKLGYI
jgi:phage-related protein